MTRYWDIAQQMPALNKSSQNKIHETSAPATHKNIWHKLIGKTPTQTHDVPNETFSINAPTLRAMQAPGRTPQTDSKWPKTVHCIGSLGAGGAERQLVNLMSTLSQRGHDKQTLLTIYPLEGGGNHYGNLLSKQKVELRANNIPLRQDGIDLVKNNAEIVDMIKQLPSSYNAWTLDIWVELMLLKPDVAHFWLDHPNIWGAPAALLAGVPAVILSTRNVHPENFPYLYAPYMQDAYKWLVTCPRVNIINNSANGGLSYADWLKVPKENFETIVNGVNLSNLEIATKTERRAIRKKFKIPQTAPVIVGAFRMSVEKRPTLFVEVLEQVKRQIPNVQGVILGEGPLRPTVEARAKELGVFKNLKLVGRRRDVDKVLSSMDVFLHTAWWEGTPNVVLEAQQLEMPVVVTNAGGSDYAVHNGHTGYLIERSDSSALARGVIDILTYQEKWKEKAKAGPAFVADRFDIDKMVDHTLQFQRDALQRSR